MWHGKMAFRLTSAKTVALATLKVILFVLVLPFAAVILGFIWSYRRVLSILDRQIYGGSILSTQSSIFYHPYKMPPSVVQLHIKFKGYIDFQLFCQKVTEAILKKVDSRGHLVYPQLQQYIRPWFGYYFWTQDPNFSIENHVVCYEDDDDDDDDVAGQVQHQITKEFCNKVAIAGFKLNFPDNTSPWLITIINNLQLDEDHGRSTGTYISFKFLHCLADGNSLFRLITQCVDQSMVQMYEPKEPSNCQLLVGHVCAPFASILESAESERKGLPKWDPRTGQIPDGNSRTLSTYCVASGDIPVENIRQVASNFGVTFTAMMLATFQAGILQYFQSKGMQVPDYFRTLFPGHAPRHPTSLTNQVSFVIADMPTSRNAPTAVQVKNYNRRLLELKNSSSSLWNGAQLNLIGILPRVWGISLEAHFFPPKQKYVVDILFSIFPGPTCEISMLGQPVMEVDYIMTALINQPMLFSLLVYNGKLRFSLATLPELFTVEETRQLVGLIEAEFDGLRALQSDNKPKRVKV